MRHVQSRDGTAIAYEQIGRGPALVLVDGALCSRSFGPMPKLAPLLARDFTVFMYDRRGRGASGDTKPYAREREVEDVAALIEEAGGEAFVLGLSSGAALALEAAASGLNITKLVLYEPPFMVDAPPAAHAGHEARLAALIAAGRRGDAVRYFMRTMVGLPAVFVVMMRLMPRVWRQLEAVAHTLPYDAAVMGDYSLPSRRLAAVSTPALVMDGEKTDRRLRRAVEAVAGVLPNAERRTLKGQTHNVKAEVLAPAVVEFLTDEIRVARWTEG
jgi:pimeloyl-ACP methyl ester carboxylesterase